MNLKKVANPRELMHRIPFSHFRIKPNERLYLNFIAIGVGLLTGFGAVGVHHLVDFFSHLFYGEGDPLVNFMKSPWWLLLLTPALAGLIVGPMIHIFAKEAKGHGVPEIMSAVLLRGGRIKLKVAIVKALASAISIGAGGSMGPEGPQAQIGATLSSVFSRFFIKKEEFIKILVAAGAGSGIAAAFNTPMAGALFAAEVILGDFSVAAFSPIILATVTATLVSQHFLGNNPFFVLPEFSFSTPWEFVMYGVLGVGAGFISLLFIWTLYFSEHFFDKKFKFPPYFKPVVGGLIVGGMGIFFPYIMGIGFSTLKEVFLGNFSIAWLFLLLFLKLIATNITLGSGHSGGVFAPALFLGAVFGAAFGSISNMLFSFHIPLGIWSVLGMAALISGTMQAPITAMLIIFEMSQNYTLLLPLMITAIIASLITMLIKKESIYTQKLALQGIDIRGSEKDDPLKMRVVEDFVQKEIDYFTIDCNLKGVVSKFIQSKQHIFPVVDNHDSKILKGILSIDDLKYIFEENNDLLSSQILIAGDLMSESDSIQFNDNLLTALDIFSKSNYSQLPVVDAKDRLVGVVSEHKILAIYNAENQKKALANAIMKKKNFHDPIQGVSIGDSIYIHEIGVPSDFVLKKIKDLRFRNLYDLEIILINNRKLKTKIFPYGDYVVKEGDEFVILGKAEAIQKYVNQISNS
ncbi:chloride channel protein [bacterium]|nr:chloride channel protein [bacterium]